MRLELVSTLHDSEVLRGPHDIEVHNGLAYVAGKFGTFTVVDVRSPEHPFVVSALTEDMTECETVLLHDGLCYVGTHRFSAVDCTDPHAPRVLASVTDPSIHAINGMAVWKDWVLAASKGGHVNVLDISDPAHPKLVGSVPTKERGEVLSPHDVAVAGDLVIVADQRGGSPHKVAIYRADADTPPDHWELVSLVDGERLDGANRLIADLPHVFVACNKADTIAVLDISDSAEPEVLSVVETAGIGPDGIELRGNVLFVGAQDRVEALDVSDARLPRWVSQERYPRLFPAHGTGAHDLCSRGDLLYVTAQHENGIGVFRIH